MSKTLFFNFSTYSTHLAVCMINGRDIVTDNNSRRLTKAVHMKFIGQILTRFGTYQSYDWRDRSAFDPSW